LKKEQSGEFQFIRAGLAVAQAAKLKIIKKILLSGAPVYRETEKMLF